MELDRVGTLAAAEAELETLLQNRADLELKIAGLRLVIQGLRQLQGLNPPADVEPEGLTDSCRAVLRCATRPLSAAEVKEQLSAIGFDWSTYSSPTSALHTVLKRLVARRQVAVSEEGGKMRYQWQQVRLVVAKREDIEDPARLDELMFRIRQASGKEEK